MASLTFYPAWLNQVNAELNRVTAGLFSAEDFDYPWIEKFMAEVTAENAAALAMTSASLAEARPPAVMNGGDSSCV